jgi:AraC family transcriptional regulator of adaptative response / DNA-3-methyladenine glycosylase II
VAITRVMHDYDEAMSPIEPPMFTDPGAAPFPAGAPVTAQACYQALVQHDPRFDGLFYVGVTSTGIYCRPVCRVRVPQEKNCRFFGHAIQAQVAGFRPCRRCRPELAPAAAAWSLQDVSHSLAQAALALLDECVTQGHGGRAVVKVAGLLGISDRHLRRLLQQVYGLGPLAYVQHKRLAVARQLLTDTQLPIHQVALSSGYGSVRAFHYAFATLDGRSPASLRRAPGEGGQAMVLPLGYRPPYAIAPLLEFLAVRAIPGIEWVDQSPKAAWHWGRSLTLEAPGHAAGALARGWVSARFEPERHRLLVTLSPSLQPHLPVVQRLVKNVFDLDAQPDAITAALGAHFPHAAGLRLPGSAEAFEGVVRAILGQQVSVAAGNTLLARFAQHFGEAAQTPLAGITRYFPTAAQFCESDEKTLAAMAAMGAMGIIKTRQCAIVATAQVMASGKLQLHPGASPNAARAQLLALPGVGPWTAHYIVMRGLHDTDAWMASDVAVHKALGLLAPAIGCDGGRASLTRRCQQATAMAAHWQPWRSYGILAAWQQVASSRLPTVAPAAATASVPFLKDTP